MHDESQNSGYARGNHQMRESMGIGMSQTHTRMCSALANDLSVCRPHRHRHKCTPLPFSVCVDMRGRARTVLVHIPLSLSSLTSLIGVSQVEEPPFVLLL